MDPQNSVLIKNHECYIRMRQQGPADMHALLTISCIFSDQAHIPSFHQISLMKHKFKDKIISLKNSNSKALNQDKTLWSVGPCVTA
jgi:hypothetical protein